MKAYLADSVFFGAVISLAAYEAPSASWQC